MVTGDAVWVIDAKRYRGRPSLRVEGGLFRPRVEKLVINGRDKTSLVDGMARQVRTVESALPDVPVRGILCFVEADWPLIGGDFRVAGVDVLWPRELVARLKRVTVGGVDVTATTARLAERFRSA